MSMTPSRPWRMITPLAAVLALFAIWSAYWLFAFTAARTYADAERQRLAREGIVLACSGESWGGYPFRFEYNCGDPVIQIRDDMKAEAHTVTVIAQAYQPWHLVALIDGPTTLHSKNRTAILLTHERGLASLNLKTPDEPLFSVEFPKLTVNHVFRADDTLVSIRKRQAGVIDIAASAARITLTLAGKPPLELDQAAADTTLAPGNILTINSASAQRGTLTVTGTGTLRLDAQNRVQGRIDTQVSDTQALLDAASPYVNMTASERSVLIAMLAAMGQKAAFSAMNGEIYWGPVKIGNAAPLF